LTERRNPATERIDVAEPLEIVDLIAAEDATIPALVHGARLEIAKAISLVEASFRAGGRLLYVGAGTSGRLGVLDASECPPTFGTPPGMVLGLIAGGYPALVKAAEGAEDDVNAGIAAMDTHGVTRTDTVIGIAASGGTPYVRAALGRAQALGASTALVACVEPPSVLRDTVDACIVVLTGPEVVTGSTRMKAGTATKLILNTDSTGAMIRLGKTYGNLMVDLQAWSAKLVDRGERIRHGSHQGRSSRGARGDRCRERKRPDRDRDDHESARCPVGEGPCSRSTTTACGRFSVILRR
jgi:N-acetylmuramic acid 6-phosphate etherase